MVQSSAQTVAQYLAGERQFREQYLRAGKRLDMGKSCGRLRKLEDLPLELIGKVIKSTSVDKFISTYELSRPGRAKVP